MKKISILTCILCLFLSVTAFAEDTDFDYTGPIDERTGLPLLDEEGEVSTANQTRFDLDNGVYAYDTDRGGYVIYVGASAEFYSNVPPGIITTGELRITIPNGLIATLYRDGVLVPDADLSYVRTAGSYALEVATTSGGSVIVYFTVVPSLTSAVSTYSLPKGFEVGSLYYEGEAQSVASSTTAYFTEDGSYQLTIVAPDVEQYISLVLDVDHTAPVILADGVVNGQADGAVTVSCDDETATIAVTLDDGTGPVAVNSLELTEPGIYAVTATDEAGNVSTMTFELLLYLNAYAILVLVLIVTGMIALWMHLAFRKKHTRVG